MQIKTTLRFHLTPVRMAKIKNSGDSRCLQGCGESGVSLEHMDTGDILLNRTPLACAVRSRIDKWNLIKLQRFCKAKDTVNDPMATNRLGKDLYQS